MEHAKTCQRPISLERRLAATYLVAGLVTAGLAGCAAGPDFQRPTAPDVAGTVAKLAMRQPFVYSKALHFKNSAYQAHFAQGITIIKC